MKERYITSMQPWFDYLKNVLGVKQVMLPETLSSEASPKLMFVLPHSPSPAESEMLSKMILAMKLKSEDVQILLVNEFLPTNSLVVAFTDGEKLNSHTNIHYTHSLSRLMNNPGLKKETWALLQQIMLKIP